mmetsp:Transcript_8376/g.4499  ORF Transcript_8376/g.4499 Transcript_8376/m.4499 type:complete len:108 (+) Transcript_8376:575-898(+)
MQPIDCPNLVVYNEIKEKVAPVVEPCVSDSNDDGLIMCTSGSTGPPKLLYLDIIGVLCKANLIAKYMHGLGPGFPIFAEGDLNCGPYQVIIGFGGLLRGGTSVFYEG